jgi:hypothetical protein
MKSVISSSVEAVGYSSSRHVLKVRFLNGSVYQYRRVPADVYDEFLHADSLGIYLSKHIRDLYPFEKVA